MVLPRWFLEGHLGFRQEEGLQTESGSPRSRCLILNRHLISLRLGFLFYKIGMKIMPPSPTSYRIRYVKLNASSVEWPWWLSPSLARPDLHARWHSPTRVGKTSSSLMRPSIQSMSKAM